MQALRTRASTLLRVSPATSAARFTAVRSLSHHGAHDDFVDPAEPSEKTKDGAVIIKNTPFSLEWVLTSPPPLHAFIESPIIVEWPEGEDTHHH